MRISCRRVRAAFAAATVFLVGGQAVSTALGVPTFTDAQKAVNIDWMVTQGYIGAGQTVGIIEAGATIQNGFDLAHPSLTNIPTSRLFDFYDWRNAGAYSVNANDNTAVTPGTNDTSFAGTGHGTNVASIIGANNASDHFGSAPGAVIWGAVGSLDPQLMEGQYWSVYEHGARILNLSYGGGGTETGSTTDAKAVDYLAYRPSQTTRGITVCAAAGNNGNATKVISPADAYNDITVGAVDSTFLKVWASSCGLRPTNNRSMVDVLAPGNQVRVAAANWEGANPDWIADNGTSLATPHVSSVVAGMNQYTDAASLPQYSKDPWISRAIIVNAANKNVKDSGNVLWKDTEANTGASDDTLVLDNELGSGLLDAKKSIQTLAAGEHGPGTIPTVGWDWDLINQTGAAGRHKYTTEIKLAAGSEFTVSLAWNRYLTIQDNIALNAADRSYQPFGEDLNGNAALNLALNEAADGKDYNRDGDTADVVSEDLDGDGTLDGADLFNFETLDNLDLYLYRVGDAANPVKRSISSVDNIEHIFFPIATEDFYRIEVELNTSVSNSAIYGLAWWGTAIPEPATAGALGVMALMRLARRQRGPRHR